MKRKICILSIVAIVSIGMLVAPVGSQASAGSENENKSDNDLYPAMGFADELTQLTGVAISPLLGLGVLGGYQYLKYPEQRTSQPWYCAPIYWVTGLLLSILFFVNDYIPLVDKFSSGFENAVNIVLPIVLGSTMISRYFSLFGANEVSSGGIVLYDSFMAHINVMPWLGLIDVGQVGIVQIIAVIFAVIAFVAVWVSGQVVDFLILINPIPIFNSVLRGFKLSLFAAVFISNAIHPYFGLLVSSLIILVALVAFRWTSRIAVFGVITSYDLLTFPWTRKKELSDSILCFADSGLTAVPNRTLGRLSRNGTGGLEFSYRPGMILPRKVVRLAEARYFVGKELLLPSLWAADSESSCPLVLFSCRYLKREKAVQEALGLSEVREMGLRRMGRGAWNYLRSFLGNNNVAGEC